MVSRSAPHAARALSTMLVEPQSEPTAQILKARPGRPCALDSDASAENFATMTNWFDDSHIVHKGAPAPGGRLSSNREILCESCGGFVLFVDNSTSIHENVLALDRAQREHQCHNDPRATRVNGATAHKWAEHLADVKPLLNERAYMVEQIRFLWEEISQLNTGLKWSRAVDAIIERSANFKPSDPVLDDSADQHSARGDPPPV